MVSVGEYKIRIFFLWCLFFHLFLICSVCMCVSEENSPPRVLSPAFNTNKNNKYNVVSYKGIVILHHNQNFYLWLILSMRCMSMCLSLSHGFEYQLGSMDVLVLFCRNWNVCYQYLDWNANETRSYLQFQLTCDHNICKMRIYLISLTDNNANSATAKGMPRILANMIASWAIDNSHRQCYANMTIS